MPRIFGHNLLFVLLAAIAIYLVGFVWYMLLFAGAMGDAGVGDTATADWRMFGVGPLTPVLYALGLAAIASKAGAAGLMAYAKLGLVCAVGFTIATELADFAYDARYTTALTLVDVAHQLVILPLGAVILSFGRK
ncbi:DUF1761 family protein [Hyphobacterium marinum]|uniref:DUF1761 family protein n=1 Tax=Hyphobacterium marinum TaxID=3116574 RepID=A0ABU7M1S5_9PROT|nr:DUF1761 family protein [Hyphobacterium sp. Y6023]MEE2567725.1 DUF1761 family protein [Hyphobacterium sp. Y6023]